MHGSIQCPHERPVLLRVVLRRGGLVLLLLTPDQLCQAAPRGQLGPHYVRICEVGEKLEGYKTLPAVLLVFLPLTPPTGPGSEG
jgi:hypothetical protein